MNTTQIRIVNNLNDATSSLMMEKVAKYCTNDVRASCDILVERNSVDGKKCEFITMVSFVMGIASSLAATIIWEVLKSAYIHSKPPKNYNWKVSVILDGEKYDVSVFKMGLDVIANIDECSSDRF